MGDGARPGLRFHDLGSVIVELDGQPVSVRGPRISPVLAMLLIHPNKRVSADALIEAIWGDDAIDNAAATLDSHLWRLRRLLEPGRARGEPFTAVVHDAAGYRLVVTADQVDSLSFDRLLGDARDLLIADQPARALARCEEALKMWRGSPWAPYSDEQWATAAVTRLVEIHAQLLETRIRALLDLGEPDRALAALEPLLEDEPLRERLWEMGMLAAYRVGRPQQALETYGRARRVLVEATGLEPGAALRSLQSKIFDRDPSLDLSPPPSSARPRSETPPGELHLPRRRTQMLGRGAELAELVEAIGTAGLVTIVGPAGCGKTRLAIETASQSSATFPDGVWFIDLTAAQDRQQMEDLVTSALGLTAPEVGDVAAAVRAHTRLRRMLLVLDNCEHLLDAAAEFTDGLLAPGSELTVLATSREPLGVDAEQLHLLTPLPLPERSDDPRQSPAVQLFLQRLTAAAPHHQVDDADIAVATEICAAVDGLPLAVELAAGQARSFTLAEIADRIRRDPAGLSQIGRSARRHHATLRGAIELSVDTLTPTELTVHQAVAVVPGPFTTDLAAHLADLTPDETDQALAGLVHRSMLNALGPQRPGGPSRFAQLATIRAHGLHHDTGGRDLAERRRDAWVAQLVTDQDRLGDSVNTSWRHTVDDNLAAVRATLQSCLIDRPQPAGPAIAVGLTLYWHYSGMVVEWKHWTTLASHYPTADPADQLLSEGSVASAAALAGRDDLHDRWMDTLDDSVGALTSRQATFLAELLLLACLTTWIAGGTDASQRAVTHLRQLHEQRAADPYLGVLADAGQLLITSRTAEAGRVIDAVEVSYRHAETGRHLYVQWMIAIAGTAAALTSRQPQTGLIWSDRVMGYFAHLGADPNVPSLEIRGALQFLAGQPTEAIRTLASARASARRIGSPWPTLPMTPDVITRARSQVSTSVADHAYRTGLLGPDHTTGDDVKLEQRRRLEIVAS